MLDIILLLISFVVDWFLRINQKHLFRSKMFIVVSLSVYHQLFVSTVVLHSANFH